MFRYPTAFLSVRVQSMRLRLVAHEITARRPRNYGSSSTKLRLIINEITARNSNKIDSQAYRNLAGKLNLDITGELKRGCRCILFLITISAILLFPFQPLRSRFPYPSAISLARARARSMWLQMFSSPTMRSKWLRFKTPSTFSLTPERTTVMPSF